MATASPIRIPIIGDPRKALKAFQATTKGMTKVGAVAAKTSIQVAKIGVAFATAGTAAAAAAIAALTPTPKDNHWISKIYKWIDVIALNIGKAKDK